MLVYSTRDAPVSVYSTGLGLQHHRSLFTAAGARLPTLPFWLSMPLPGLAAHHGQGRRPSRPGLPPFLARAAAHHDQGRCPSRPGPPPIMTRAAAHHDQCRRPSRPGPPPITTRAAVQGCPLLGPGFQVGPLLPIVEPVRTYYLDPEPTSGLPLGTTGATGPSLPRLPQCGAWLTTVG